VVGLQRRPWARWTSLARRTETPLDTYTLRARVAPLCIAILPAVVAMIAAGVAANASGVIFAAVIGAVAIVVAIVVRDAGRRLQPSLWEDWGGSPTLRRLRWSESTDREGTARLHSDIEAVTAIHLPTAREEEMDANEADSKYERAIGVLRDLTRDQSRFPLVFDENVDYGFRRNSLGIRTFGLVVGVIVLALSAAFSIGSPTPGWLISDVVALLAVIFWAGMVNPQWVRSAAERYADKLMDAVQVLKLKP
jgi:hypothetical protein